MQPQNTPNDNSTNSASGQSPASPKATPATGPASSGSPTVVTPGASPHDVLAAQAMVNQPMSGQTVVSTKKRRLKRLVLPITLVLVVLLGGSAAAYFGYVVPNKPENLWASALKNTGKGYHRLVSYQEQHKNDKGGDIKGNYAVDGSAKSDGKLEASWYDGSGLAKLDLGLGTTRATFEGRLIKSASKNPDLYFNVGGIKGLGAQMGSAATEQLISKINNQWVVIDHTLLDNLEKQLGQNGSSKISLTADDYIQIFNKLGEAFDAHVFTDQPNQAAFVIKQKIGKETRNGRVVYHYKATVDKQQLKALVTMLKTKLDETKLKQLNNGKSVLENLNVDSLVKDIDSIDTNKAVADAWVDTQTKVFQAVRITSADQPGEYVEFGTPYTGGDVMPFVVKVASMSGDLTMKVNFNPKAAKSTVTVEAKSETNLTFNLSLEAGPRSTPVTVDKPAAAKPLAEVLGVDLTTLLQQYSGGSSVQGQKSDLRSLFVQ